MLSVLRAPFFNIRSDTHVPLMVKIMVADSCFGLAFVSSPCHCVSVNKSSFSLYTSLSLSFLNPLSLLQAVLYKPRVYNRNSWGWGRLGNLSPVTLLGMEVCAKGRWFIAQLGECSPEGSCVGDATGITLPATPTLLTG